MKLKQAILIFLFPLILSGCNNYFHDLIPPDENRIISFFVKGQIKNSVINNNTVLAIVDTGTPVDSLIPVISISHKATILPITLNYLQEAFPRVDIPKAMVGLLNAQDQADYVLDLIEKNPDFNIPVINKPIDFTGPVIFIVISGQGSIRQYTVNVVIDTGLPRLIGFGFSKYDNRELIQDAITIINENAKVIQAVVLYPAEMDYLSYSLIPSFLILGDRVEIDGDIVRSGIDAIQFEHGIMMQQKTVTVWRNEDSLDYTLVVVFNEDSDSIRSITDFRFDKADNSSIAATAVGSIINNDSLGTIKVQVFYSGAKPTLLTPSFLSPGTVSVNSVNQISGVNSHNFSSQVEYTVVSRNNLYTRTYTVTVDFIDISASLPVIRTFNFTSALNPILVQDVQSQISQSTGQIIVAVRYRGSIVPDILIPEFTATGIVTVNGSIQTSGFSAQNFTRQIRYTVTSIETQMTKDYWVQVNFSRDISSEAFINSFSFHPDENTGLLNELVGRIDHNAGKITIFAPFGSDVSVKTMYPRFTSIGQVRVNNIPQTNGTSGQRFELPIEYEVIAANNVNRRTYTVTVRETQSTIYVNPSAVGEGDGTSWQDAFRSLKAATEAAALFPEDVPKEIWIARGTYLPSETGNREEYYLITANTSYIGGFAGWEESKSMRNADLNPVIISGDLGSGQYSWQLFASGFTGVTARRINGDVSFEDISFKSARASTASGERRYGSAICVALNLEQDSLTVKNCTFNDLQAFWGGAIFSRNGIVDISDTVINTTSATLGGAIYLTGTGSAQLNSVTINNSSASSSGGGIFAEKTLTVSGLSMDNVSATSNGGGIYSIHNFTMSGLPSVIKNVQANDGSAIYLIGAGYSSSISSLTVDTAVSINSYIYSTHNLNLRNSSFQNITSSFYGVYISSPFIEITETKFSNINFGINGSVIRLSSLASGAVFLNNVIIDGVSNGRGIDIISRNSLLISNSQIKSIEQASFGFGSGMQIYNEGYAEILNTTLENITGYDSGGISYNGVNNATYNSSLLIKNSTFRDIIALNWFGAINLNGRNVVIEDSLFENCTARYDYKILSQGSDAIIRNSTFIHDNRLRNPGNNPNIMQSSRFFSGGGTFIDCTFTNLRSNKSGSSFLFDTWGDYPVYGVGSIRGFIGNLILRNCTFNFNSGSVGLFASFQGVLTNGVHVYDRFLMDGVNINWNGGQAPIIYMSRHSNAVITNTFQMRLNNRFNGLPMYGDVFNALVYNNIILLEGGAVPTIVP